MPEPSTTRLDDDLVDSAAPRTMAIDKMAGTATGEGADVLIRMEGAIGSAYDDAITGFSDGDYIGVHEAGELHLYVLMVWQWMRRPWHLAQVTFFRQNKDIVGFRCAKE